MKKTLFLLFLSLFLVSGCGVQNNSQNNNQQLANPASVACVEKGGQIEMKERGDGGQYGICVFPDGKQCEEWTLFRGECGDDAGVTPVGTEEENYCVLTGGETDLEVGSCTTTEETTCDLNEYFEGGCE